MRIPLLLALLAMFYSSHAAKIETVTQPASVPETEAQKTAQHTSITSISVKEIEQQLGRKLNLKEKIGLILIKKQLRRAYPGDIEGKRANTNAVLGFSFAIASLLFGLFVIPGLILSNSALKAEKQNPGTLTGTNKSLAKIGQIFSYVYIGLLVIGLIIIATYLLLLFGR